MTQNDKLYKHQHDYIQREFGEEAAVKANYGWGSMEGYVETKIYGLKPLTKFAKFQKVYEVTK